MPWPTFSLSASSSSAGSSSLTRPREATFLFLGAVASISTFYYFYHSYVSEPDFTPPPGQGLRRRNAIRDSGTHLRRRRSTATRSGDPTLSPEDQIENLDFDGQRTIVPQTLTDGETVIDHDDAFQEEYPWQNAPPSYERSGQNIVQLLFRVSEDATRRNAYVHRGCACNGCGSVPIRGIRYRCANCADYDLCEGCESQGLHTKSHIFYKIKVPAPAFGPRHIQPVWYSGDPDSIPKPPRMKEAWTKLSRETGFERPELDAYWEQWTFMANTEWREDPDDLFLAMDRKTFERCLVPSGGYRHTAPSLIFDRMFAFYDTNKDELIGFPEFLHGIAYRRKKDKWKKVFEGYDIDGDGFVDRKDFLRMFRSYYVLHRQLHRDMLEGMEEQQMSSTEARRLVSSRQPLSSAFGQDGRYPPAPDIRTGEGKAVRANGDWDIVDGGGVLNENTTDTGNRKEVFRRDGTGLDWMRRSRGSNDARFRPVGYWETMLNPPESADELIDQETRERTGDRPWRVIRGPARSQFARRVEPHHLEGMIEILGDSPSDSDDEDQSPREWPPRDIEVIDEDAEAVEGPGTRVADVSQSSRKAVTTHALFRRRAQREAYERWQRRNFYTDEEEGGTAPEDWKEDDDILAATGMAGESSKSSTRPINHSRSSSRVRFAEDMDDFDTRSNPSTSSRSVPERWGGIEIPDAEKDAGKEILYQVTQQAFNELLDPLFKEREDLAVEVVQTIRERDENKDILNMSEFISWARHKSQMEIKANTAETSSDPANWGLAANTKIEVEETGIAIWPPFPEIDIAEIRQRPLEQLLEATGYSIRVEGDDALITGDEPFVPESRPIDPNMEDDDEGSHLPVNPPISASESLDRFDFSVLQHNGITISRSPGYYPTIPQSDETLSAEDAILARYRRPRQIVPPTATPATTSPDSPTYRDPTLPQFRPDTISPSPSPSSTPSSTGADAGAPPIKERLYRLWQIEEAIRDSKEKGGWGRLGFEEFERLVSKFVKEGRGNQMDYLGSWIEFCIP